MTVEKRGNKFCTIHCLGKDKGKIIDCFDTEKEAEIQHKVIQVSKYNKIEENNMINIKKLFNKSERGLRKQKVKVTREGKTFYREQMVGRKEEETNKDKLKNEIEGLKKVILLNQKRGFGTKEKERKLSILERKLAKL